ncbi:hypothetical protein PVK06_040358 [Gossypium arboreum]|uniref:RNase H type-1 domain-containing protein n=1 Tax=Gossypium arboreum TaxID=29729 RepID=A0ABR0N7E0_GOSAR|nr:hypothetical protein PVK06_040358 [Gossypium arboreum]
MGVGSVTAFVFESVSAFVSESKYAYVSDYENTFKFAVKAIQECCSEGSTSALIRRIHQILSQENQWFLKHIPRENNYYADYIAKLAFVSEEDLRLYDSPPDEVLDFLKSDKEGLFTPLGFSL